MPGCGRQRERFRAWQQQWRQSGRPARRRPGAVAFDGSAVAPRVRGSVRQVIDRALSQVGVQYVWGGGNGRGPSTGIPDAVRLAAEPGRFRLLGPDALRLQRGWA